jgi:hypothetical protein
MFSTHLLSWLRIVCVVACSAYMGIDFDEDLFERVSDWQYAPLCATALLPFEFTSGLPWYLGAGLLSNVQTALSVGSSYLGSYEQRTRICLFALINVNETGIWSCRMWPMTAINYNRRCDEH